MHGDCLVEFRFNSNHELSRIWFFGGFAPISTKIEIVIHGIFECRTEITYCFPLKGHNIPKIDDFTMKEICVIIKFNFSNIAFVFHHLITSASFKNFRIELTAPLSVTRLGWGL